MIDNEDEFELDAQAKAETAEHDDAAPAQAPDAPAAEAEAAAEPAIEAEAKAPAPEPAADLGVARIRNADGGGCSYRGESYEPDHDGVVTVPLRAVEELVSHGFALVS